MDTTRNAETPPNLARETSQKWPEKVPNVASETLEKKQFRVAAIAGRAVLSRCNALQPCRLLQSDRKATTKGQHSKRWITT